MSFRGARGRKIPLSPLPLFTMSFYTFLHQTFISYSSHFSFLSLISTFLLPLSRILFLCQMYWLVSEGRKSVCLHLLPYLGPHLPYLSEGKPEATHWYRLLYMHTHSNVHEFIERLYFPLKLSGVFLFYFFLSYPECEKNEWWSAHQCVVTGTCIQTYGHVIFNVKLKTSKHLGSAFLGQSCKIQ